jgi:hypothetical protein
MGASSHGLFLSYHHDTASELRDLERLTQRLFEEHPDFRIVVVGECRSGKSTLINALLDQAIENLDQAIENIRLDERHVPLTAYPHRHKQPQPWENLPDFRADPLELNCFNFLTISRSGNVRCVRVDRPRLHEEFSRLLKSHLRRIDKLIAIFLRRFALRPPRAELVTIEREWFLYHGIGRPPHVPSWAATDL